jgi:hypothetical protein
MVARRRATGNQPGAIGLHHTGNVSQRFVIEIVQPSLPAAWMGRP